jgi:hypothetical protein
MPPPACSENAFLLSLLVENRPPLLLVVLRRARAAAKISKQKRISALTVKNHRSPTLVANRHEAWQ